MQAEGQRLRPTAERKGSGAGQPHAARGGRGSSGGRAPPMGRARGGREAGRRAPRPITSEN
ncbi:hypothetical protein EYF80_046294 [Liparis tanakae]|uniref:Uncharacterized protein n=1 Tax=Liparis tanakae TaxID=230148 RepID=A0A4Z2FQJ2_9TELE|nr:hypothetical protein EYF80_046294 [Liparis tanakae]